jgi:hypothetical protein
VLSTPGLRWVVLMEGINDIGHSTAGGLPEQDVSSDQIIAGMKQVIARVRAPSATPGRLRGSSTAASRRSIDGQVGRHARPAIILGLTALVAS